MAEPDAQTNSNSLNPIILKLGGSVLSHSNKLLDFNYLREFRDLVRDQILLGKKFVVISGGGQTSREYMEYAQTEGNITNARDLHWIGTAVNTLHAEMIRGFFGDDIAEKMVWKYQHHEQIPELNFDKPVAVAGGFKAGRSSDWAALQVAKGLGATKVFDLKNIDGVYSDDPKLNPDAEFFPEMTWKQYLDMIGNPVEHKPGANLPVDVVAAREASQLKIEYYILKATDLFNLEKALAGEEFKGTIIK